MLNADGSILSGITNQTVSYRIMATGLESYDQGNTVSVEWCDAQGNEVSNPNVFTTDSSRSNWLQETTNGQNYTVYYNVSVSNKVALEPGYYYFKVKVNEVESLPILLTVK